jgi:hypothetical protein
MTLETLIATSRAVLDETTASFFTDVNILSWINEAERDIAAKTGCIEIISQITTTINNRLVAFIGNKVNSVEYIGSGGELIMLPGSSNIWEDIDDSVWYDISDNKWMDVDNQEYIPFPPVSNMRMTPHNIGHVSLRGVTTPQYWFQWGNYIAIEPKPDAEYTLNLYVSISPTEEMSSNDDVPQIPIEFQDAIVLYVVSMGMTKARQFSTAANKYMEYTAMLQYLIDKYIRRRAARPIDVRNPDMVGMF